MAPTSSNGSRNVLCRGLRRLRDAVTAPGCATASPRTAVARVALATVEQLEARVVFASDCPDAPVPFLAPPPPDCPPPTTAEQAPDVVDTGSPDTTTLAPVRYVDGLPIINAADLESDGFGKAWGVTRTWTGLNNASQFGNGWAATNQPFLMVWNTSGTNRTLCAVDGGGAQRFFNETGGHYNEETNTYGGYTYASRYHQQDVMEYTPPSTVDGVAVPGEFKLTDSAGNVTRYFDLPREFGELATTAEPLEPTQQDSGFTYRFGAFKSFTDQSGHVTTAAYYNEAGDPNGRNGDLHYVERADAASGQAERFTYEYQAYNNSLTTAASIPDRRQVSKVTLARRDTAAGAFATVRTAEYLYYTGETAPGANDPHGRLGDLKTVTIKDAADGVVDQEYYRYYKFTGSYQTTSPANNSYAHTAGPAPLDYREEDGTVLSGLKSVFRGASVARLAANVAAHESAPDVGPGGVLPYADHYFKYERWGSEWADYHLYTRYRVTEEFAQGAGCSTCSGGLGTFRLDYAASPSLTGQGNVTFEPNVWRGRTIEYLPDTTNPVAARTSVGTPDVYDEATDTYTYGTSELTSSGTTVTVTWPGHKFQVGDLITVAGANEAEYNGTFTIAAVAADGSTFEYVAAAAPSYYLATGTITVTNHNRVDPSAWADNDRNVVYVNEAGQVMLKVLAEPGTGRQWGEFYRYDAEGRVQMKAHPSALNLPADLSTLEQHDTLLNADANGNYQYVRDAQGLVELSEYGAATTANLGDGSPGNLAAGDVKGYFKSHKLRRGETNAATDALQRHQTYYQRTAGGATVYPVATATVYRAPTANVADSGKQTTTYGYTWMAGTVQQASATVTAPVVTAGQNGPNTAVSETTVLDRYGRTVWARDGDGFISHTGYDPDTGAVVKAVADVDTGQVADEPAGWATPAGGGLHLTTLSDVDGLGRATKVTDPNGNVTHTVYKDGRNATTGTLHEVRTYRGWNSVAHTATGPVEVSRAYWPAAGSAGGERRVYTESLTTSAAPTFNSSTNAPTGQESIAAGNVQSLARTLTNDAGQVVQSDAYVSLAGVTYATAAAALGVAGTNYHRTRTDYDGRGRVKRVENAVGTVTRQLYDARGLPTQTWVGTDDTPTSDFWSPANTAGTDLVLVARNEYDGGGANVGNGTLTRATVSPDGVADGQSGNTQPDRTTEYYHDWRGRRIATKAGAADLPANEAGTVQRPIAYCELNNLGQDTTCLAYDGDGQPIARVPEEGGTDADGVPDKPSASLLRAKQEKGFDEWGRVHESRTFSVDPSTGSVSANSLKAQTWSDKRGNVIKTVRPGGLVGKTQYDGAGRATKAFATDGGGDAGYGDADDVAGDKVLEQAEPTYDANGNTLLTTARQRFHDETGTGELGGPNSTTSTKARVSYAASYYDAADRPTAQADFGTNGGTLDGAGAGADLDANNDGTADRPAAVPGRADKALVTSYTYDPAGRVRDVTDPKGIVARTGYDLLGRTTKTVEAYSASVNNGNPTDSANRTTLYTHDGLGHVLTLRADLPDGQPDQTTEYAYGVTAAGGSDVTSKDLLGEVRYPDASTGAASTSSADKEQYAYNVLGQPKTMTDQNGNVHTYGYDVLGRTTSDAVTTLGSGVDGTVRRQEVAYDTQGLPYLFTQYNAAAAPAATNVLNQVRRAFNGFGQLTAEYQSVGSGSGSAANQVSLTGTPKVQYAYEAANHSRLDYVTYPDGRVVQSDYGAAGGVNDRVSRPAFLADGTATTTGTHLEELSYLGLGTVVERNHPQPGLNLTYVGAGTADAGDKYVGLDRFGRVADHRWAKGTNDVDRFGYAYDRNSNRVGKDWSSFQMPAGGGFDEAYAYDNLDRLTKVNRGNLAGGTVADAAATYSQQWDNTGSTGSGLDALGNWKAVTTDANGAAAGGATTQARQHNAQNQIATVGGATSPAYDAAGSMTTDETGQQYTYDAWNRTVRVKNTAGAEKIVYTLDPLGRRVREDVQAAGTGSDTDLYYSAGWQVLEERPAGGTTAKAQNVWSPVYVDALVARDTPATTGTGGTAAGALDASFSGDGKATVPVGAATDSEVRAVRQGDGKIVVLGSAAGDLALARFNADGSLDTSFSGDGVQTTDFGGTELGQGLAVQADGKLLVAGQTSNGSDAVVARFNADGSLDAGFDGDGKLAISFATYVGAADVLVEGSGKILLALGTSGDEGVMRLTSAGALDTTYAGGAGYRMVDFGGTDAPQRMTFDGSGRVVVSGMSSVGDATLFRLTTGGDPDAAFSGDGKTLVDFGGPGDEGAGVAIDASGRIVVGGTGGANADLAVARVLADGTLDTTFGTNGVAYASFGPGADEGEDLAIDSSGRIVVGGTADADTAMAVARFNANGTLDASFDADGKVRVDFASGTTYENAEAMTLQTDGKIVIAGRAGGDFAVARLHAETSGGQGGRHYAVQDANYNVTAVADVYGAVVDRFQYTAYGEQKVLDADFTADADGVGEVAQPYGFQGTRRDANSGNNHHQKRDDRSSLGRWTQADPDGYVDGLNLYEFVRSGPVIYTDPTGLAIPLAIPAGVGAAALKAAAVALGISVLKCLVTPACLQKALELSREAAQDAAEAAANAAAKIGEACKSALKGSSGRMCCYYDCDGKPYAAEYSAGAPCPPAIILAGGVFCELTGQQPGPCPSSN